MGAQRIPFPVPRADDRPVFRLEEIRVGGALAFHSDRGKVVRRVVIAVARGRRVIRRAGATAEHREDLVAFDDGHAVRAGYAVMSVQWRLVE